MAGSSPGSLVLTFEIFNGGEFLRREELSAESVTIGKGPAAMLRIEDPSLQDLHAVLNVNEDGTVQLLDLVGDQSTQVNGASVSNVVLSNGDTLGFGAVRVVVRITDSAAFADDEATRVDSPAMQADSGLDAASEAPEAQVFAGDDEPAEDVMAFVMRASASATDAASDRSRGRHLEVAQVFGDAVLDIKHFGAAGSVVVGSATLPIVGLDERASAKNGFFVPVEFLPADNYVLFQNLGGQWVCNASDKWAGFVDIGETRRTFAELVADGKAKKSGSTITVQIPEDARLVVDLGNTIFVAHQAYPGKKAVGKFGTDIDYPFLGIIAFMTFVTFMFGVAIAVMPPPPDSSNNLLDDHMVELLLEKKEEIKDEKKRDDNPDAGEGAKAKKEEGKVGKKDAKMDKAKGDKVQMQKQQLDKEVAENAGVLGALRDDSALDSMLGATGLNADMMSGIGGLIGAKGTQIGSGGLGARGSGLGGGGTAEGLGGLGTKGRGSGASGYGSGGGNFGTKGDGGIGTVGGDPIILGALDKSLIDAVIKRNMSQIRYCYQRELTKNPSLGGKITVKFVIAKDGTVSSATTKTTTMNNPAVESCINGRFMRFQFPEPKGGGIVIVSYPFIFSPG
ncbi:MAG: AgmX/PglI C-terminal domain-containing protein [Myxococcota bacterium]